VSDVVGGPLLEEVAASYERVVVLLPEERVVRSRRGERHTSWIYRLFADETPRIGMWLDNGDLTPEQTAAAILRR
jgi:hypothetical protein